MDIRYLWEHICTFLPLSEITSIARLSRFHNQICSPASSLWIKLLSSHDMMSSLYYTTHTNWKLLCKLACQTMNWDPTCLAHKATQCMTKEYLIPMLYNDAMQDKTLHLPHISCVCLLGLAGSGRTFFLKTILPSILREKINVLALNINPFPTIEQLEEGVEQAITDQKPLVIIVDDLTDMNGVYAHPFVTKTNYPGRFVKVLERVKSTYNRILFIVSINQDTTALQLFAGAIEWDWILYFGVPEDAICNLFIRRQFGDQEFLPKKDFPDILERIKGHTISDMLVFCEFIRIEFMRALMEDREPSLKDVLAIRYMTKPPSHSTFATFLLSLHLRSLYGFVLVNSSEHDAPVVRALMTKHKLEDSQSESVGESKRSMNVYQSSL